MKENKPEREPRLDRQAWIDATLQVLTTDSVEAVLVAPMARKLGVTKGSFYWHFTGRDDLLNAALEQWRKRATKDVITHLESKFDSAEARLRELFRISIGSKYDRYEGKIEMAIRNWARQEPSTQAVVEEVDRERLKYLTSQYMRLGFNEDEAYTRSILQTSFSSGNGLIFGIGDSARRLDYANRCFEIILGSGALAPAQERA